MGSYGKSVHGDFQDKFDKLMKLACTTKAEGKLIYYFSGDDADDKVKMRRHCLTIQSEMKADAITAAVLLPALAKKVENSVRLR